MGDDAPALSSRAAHAAPAFTRRGLLRDGTPVLIRPIGPADAAREQAFVRALSPESRYLRFMNTLRELTPEMLDHFTHPDPDREIALVALTASQGDVEAASEPVQIGVARCVRGPDRQRGEFAIVVADAFQGKGLGTLLMRALLQAVRACGLQRIEGLVLATNHRMLALMAALGFAIHTAPDDPRMRLVVKQLC